MISQQEIDRIKAYLRTGELPPVAVSNQYRFKHKAAQFELRGDRLYHTESGLEVVNDQRAKEIIDERYKESTLGRDKLWDQLKREYYGISQRDVNKYLQSQESQQVHKPVATRAPIVSPTKVRQKNQQWLIDTTIYEVGPNENLYIVVIIDAFSKFIWAKGFVRHNNKAISAADTANFMRTVMTDQNYPKTIKSDGGVEWMAQFNDFLTEFAAAHGGYPKHLVGGPYLKNHTAMVERANRTIKSMISKYMTINHGPRFKASPRVLNWVVDQYNNAKHETTGFTPESLHNGQANPVEQRTAAKRIRKIADKTIAQTHREFPNVIVGDRVRVSIYATNPENIAKREHRFIKGYKAAWSKEIWTVVKKYGGKYVVRLDDREIKTTRNNLQLIV